MVPMTNILPMTMSTGSWASIRPMGVRLSLEFRAPWKPKFDWESYIPICKLNS